MIDLSKVHVYHKTTFVSKEMNFDIVDVKYVRDGHAKRCLNALNGEDCGDVSVSSSIVLRFHGGLGLFVVKSYLYDRHFFFSTNVMGACL